jgi:hypothetical protein
LALNELGHWAVVVAGSAMCLGLFMLLMGVVLMLVGGGRAD